MTTTLMYFAWIKERIGKGEEDVSLPDDVITVDDLITWLVARGDNYAHAFEDREVVRAAIDQEFADPGDPIAGAREIAFFPPVTGG